MNETPVVNVNVPEPKSIASQLGSIVGNILWFFLYPALCFWGWNALAPHLNAPLFGYWEVLCIGWGFRWLTANLRK